MGGYVLQSIQTENPFAHSQILVGATNHSSSPCTSSRVKAMASRRWCQRCNPSRCWRWLRHSRRWWWRQWRCRWLSHYARLICFFHSCMRFIVRSVHRVVQAFFIA